MRVPALQVRVRCATRQVMRCVLQFQIVDRFRMVLWVRNAIHPAKYGQRPRGAIKVAFWRSVKVEEHALAPHGRRDEFVFSCWINEIRLLDEHCCSEIRRSCHDFQRFRLSDCFSRINLRSRSSKRRFPVLDELDLSCVKFYIPTCMPVSS